MANTFDLTIVGGGIIGLATAMQAAATYPDLRILVLEKERELAAHQTGHNSGVVHAGIYYRPGSLKAQTCVSGRKELLRFCDENEIPYDLCGKVVVATDPEEIPRLEELWRRGTANSVPGLELIGPERLKEIEPHAAGIRALYSPATGVIDFTRVARAFADRFKRKGGEIRTSHPVREISESNDGLILETPAGEVHSRYLINCAGLFVDRVARMTSKLEAELRIVPFRGEYYTVIPERRSLVRGLIYPVPDPRFPFLGVHFTRGIEGEIEAGPNAVLALARQGYRKRDINLRDLSEIFSYTGFWSLAGKYWRTGLEETYRSFSKRAFVKALRRLVPEIRGSDLAPGGAGVRAQAVSPTGDLIDDFVIRQSEKAIHVLNAPSPGATASLAIGRRILDMAGETFGLTCR
jgi:L-2-hydroxyglutarate oxidase LhgO